MARKKRTTKTVKRSTRKKSDSDLTSNSVSDENDAETRADSIPIDKQNAIQSPSEKNHKHVGKFRYLERRHSSSQEEDNEFNPTYDNLMPQEINDIVLGNVKQFFITESDGGDMCRGTVVNNEVIASVESDALVVSDSNCDRITSPKDNERTEDIVPSSHESTTKDDNIELNKSFEKSVNIVEDLNDSIKQLEECKSIDKDLCSEDLSINNINVATGDNTTVLDNDNSSTTSSSAHPPKDVVLETKKCVEETQKNQSDERRRRSNRIRGNRWGDGEVKPVLQEECELNHPQNIIISSENDGIVNLIPINLNKRDIEEIKQDFEVQAPPPPPPANNLFDSDKPVKVKSRWRRTSELEMGGSTGSVASENEANMVSSLRPESPEASVVDIAVEQGLKSFEIISHNVFIAPRVKSKEKEIKKMICDCSLSKEEIARGDMGCGEDCLNRLLMIECGSRCLLGNHCSNKKFQNCQYTPCQVIKTKKKGLGLIANINVGAGEFLMEYVGEVLDSKEFRRRAKEYSKGKISHFYFMYLRGHTIIDATVKGNISRFINHSCDPNSETQKWTVNGELRIGFFSKRPIAAGEEITFDYKLDRYGKEAQRCFCESSNCRGWIGETPENEKDKDKKESSSKKEKKEKEKKKKEERKRDFMSDRELEEEIEKLATTGVKNQKHTLTLCRLMVRAEENSQRTQLLEIAQGADIRCLRLFLDYHGLSLLWSWMVDSRCSPQLKMEILNILAVLPLSNRTVLQDSKVLAVTEKWANKNKSTGESKERSNDNDSNESTTDSNGNTNLSEKNEELKKNITSKATELLGIWSNLKQEFRIPKKERMEQMKEHEREANRGNYSDPREHLSYDRHWNYDKESRGYEKENNRYSNNHRERKRGRESPLETGHGDWRKSRSQQEESRHNGGMNRLSKTERRQLFAMKVEEEERQRKMEEWAKQQPQPQVCGPPVPTPPPRDPNQSYYQQPPFQQPQDGNEMVFGGCPPAFPPPFMAPPHGPPPFMEGPPPTFPNGHPTGPPPGGFHPPPFGHPPIAQPYQPSLPPYPPFPFNAPPQAFPPNPSLPTPAQNPPLPSSVPLTTPPPGTSAPPVIPIPNVPPPILNNPPLINVPLPAVSLTAAPNSAIAISTAPPPPPPVARVFPIKLPHKWRSAKDKEGRIYYYHTKTRKSQWQIPTEETVPHASESDSDSEESSEDDDSSTDEEEEEEKEEDEDIFEEQEKKEEDEEYTPEDLKFEDFAIPELVLPSPPVLKKRRDGLVQVNIISPRDGEDDYRCGIKKKQIRQTKERLAREKRRLRSGGAAKCEADTSGSSRRRIKEMFRVQMANVVVTYLNPYRKQDCKHARISNTEDFKHLARKLTHFVMVKEMKHCASLDELVCNDNVKHKAKDFIRKYMSKFGPVYKRSPDD